MRYFLLAAATILLGASAALAQRGRSPVKPFVPQPAQPIPPGTNPALAMYPNMQSYFASAFFYQDFGRRYAETQPAILIPPPPPPPPPPPELDPTQAKVTLQVPETAEVFVEGEKLKQNGTTRDFVSPPLQQGERMIYKILVRWSDGKKPAERSLSVTVGPGDRPVLLVMNPLMK